MMINIGVTKQNKQINPGIFHVNQSIWLVYSAPSTHLPGQMFMFRIIDQKISDVKADFRTPPKKGGEECNLLTPFQKSFTLKFWSLESVIEDLLDSFMSLKFVSMSIRRTEKKCTAKLMKLCWKAWVLYKIDHTYHSGKIWCVHFINKSYSHNIQSGHIMKSNPVTKSIRM